MATTPPEPPNFQPNNLSTRINDLRKKWHVPGLSLALITANQPTKTHSFGLAHLSPPQPSTTETIYDFASTAKSLTAAAIAILVQDPAYPSIQWDSKMCSLLPEDFVMSQESYTRDVTLEDILSHRSGLPSHDLSYLGQRAHVPDSPKSITRNLRNLPITAPIRTRFQYCNLMYTVATHLVEVVTGETWERFLQKHFFGPLGMNSTRLHATATRAAGLGERIATPYFWDEDTGRLREGCVQAYMPQAQGAGSIFSSVEDWARYLRAVMFREGPITDAVYAGVTEARIVTNPSAGEDDDDDDMPFTSLEVYGAGWEIRWYRGYKIVQHDGGVPGFGSVVFFVPKKKFGGVIVGNGDEAGTIGEIISKELIDEILEVPEDERVDWDAWYREAQREYKESKVPMLKQLCPDLDEPQPLERNLKDYVGDYWNVGYHQMVVQIKDGQLFIDASDRSEAFYLTLEHACDQTKFVGHMVDYYDGSSHEFAVEFRIEGNRVVSLGVKDEGTYDEYVWYVRK